MNTTNIYGFESMYIYYSIKYLTNAVDLDSLIIFYAIFEIVRPMKDIPGLNEQWCLSYYFCSVL